jgi:hypothetical protein
MADRKMPELNRDALTDYLQHLWTKPVRILGITPIGEVSGGDSMKTYGYGKPVRLDYHVEGEGPMSAVLHTSSPDSFGHENMADRAQALLWSHSAFNRLPHHVPSLDVGAFRDDGTLVPLGNAAEFFLLTEYAPGRGYKFDLERLRDTDILQELDVVRADALCDYLVEIHREPGTDPGLYTRRVRELVGHGECIMGLIDSYPPHPLIRSSLLEAIERRCVEWRWKLRSRTHRLRQVHGDFHPWNILFEDDSARFHVLDRSRGEWGDPADDVSSLAANYLFFSLQRSGRLEGALANLFHRFWRRYLDGSGDAETLQVVAPFLAFRCLVMASPVWYPALRDDVRGKLFAFMLNILNADRFDPAEVNRYLGA